MSNGYVGTKYPKECASIVRNQTLGVVAELSLATAANGQSPLKIFDDRFSRFVFSVINEAKATATGNIPVGDFENIAKLTEIAQRLDLESALMPAAAQTGDSSPAYTVQIVNGKLKGRTPAEVLIAEGDAGVTQLNNQYKWLSENLAKYPGNKAQMDAITDAAALWKAGKLNQQSAPASANGKVVTLYNAPYRALIRKKREDGKSKVYDVKITWTIGQDYPVVVRISNYYAPVIQTDKGTLNVKASEASDKLDCEMKLTAEEWNDTLRRMRYAMMQFMVLHSKDCINDAADADKRNREAAAANKDS